MSNSYVPLYIFLGLLLSIGVLLPFFIAQFVDISIYSSDSVIAPFIDIFSNGFVVDLPFLDPINLDIFFWIPEFARDSMEEYFNTLSYIPNFLSIPIMIVMFFSLVYVVIKFIPAQG